MHTHRNRYVDRTQVASALYDMPSLQQYIGLMWGLSNAQSLYCYVEPVHYSLPLGQVGALTKSDTHANVEEDLLTSSQDIQQVVGPSLGGSLALERQKNYPSVTI